MGKMMSKLLKLIPALAIITGIAALNSACIMIFHQPEISDELNQYRK